MKSIFTSILGFLIAALPCGPAIAWSHANSGGGSTSHSYGSGSTTRTDAAGGSETHTYGQGTTATGAYGGSASHEQGSGETSFHGADGGSATHYAGYGTTATGAYGGTAYHPPYYGAAYPAYHPPTSVNVYGSSCGGCGGWNTAGAAAAGAAVGVVAGEAAASSNSAAAQSNAYAQGYNAGAGAAGGYAMGAIYPTLPGGCMQQPVNGQTYYLCGNTWFSPNYGANGVYYRVVPTP